MRRDLIRTAIEPSHWWNQAPWSSNQLMRPSDRLWSSLVISAVAIGALAVPVAAAVGTSVYASGRARIEQQHNVYSQWSGTVSATPGVSVDGIFGAKATTGSRKDVTWTMNGISRTEPMTAHFDARPGETITVWTDEAGDQVPPPPQTSIAAVDGIAAAITLYSATILSTHVTLSAAGSLIRWYNDRAWEKEWLSKAPPLA